MKIEKQTEDQLILSDHKTANLERFWLIFGIILIVGFGYFIANGTISLTRLELVLSIVSGITLALFYIGILISETPGSTIVLNRSSRYMSIHQENIFRKKHFTYSFDEIEEFSLIEDEDFDDVLSWHIEFSLTNGESVQLAPSTSYLRKGLPGAEENISLIKSYFTETLTKN